MRILITAILLALSMSLSAQVMAVRVVFSNLGTSSSSSAGLNASTTVGEPIIGTVTTSRLTVTQGFQQSDEGSVNIETPWTDQLEISVFPNPVVDEMSLKLKGTLKEPLRVQLFDARGRIVPGWNFSVKQEGLVSRSTSALATGTYFLRVSQSSGGQVQSLPIIRR